MATQMVEIGLEKQAELLASVLNEMGSGAWIDVDELKEKLATSGIQCDRREILRALAHLFVTSDLIQVTLPPKDDPNPYATCIQFSVNNAKPSWGYKHKQA